MQQSLFNSIKKSYFPRWDQGSHWKLKVAGIRKRFGEFGYCDDVSKTIYIASEIKKKSDLQVVMIHEICHAVTRTGHGKMWARRLLKAAKKAKELKNFKLEAALKKEVAIYKNSPSRLKIVKFKMKK